MAGAAGEPGFTFVFAALGVADIAASAAWYERLLGRAPDLVPNGREAAWRLTDTGWIYVVAGDARAGRGLVTILVDGIDDHVAGFARRGLPVDVQTVPEGRRATLTDPDGNTLAFVQPHAS
jgi:catechol 2,3-dioxygenase-like lactoylglutathione lyase family enzyme